jgi:hypothetical protein
MMPSKRIEPTNRHHVTLLTLCLFAFVLLTAAFIPSDVATTASPDQLAPFSDPGQHPQTDDDIFADDFSNNDNEWAELDEDEFGSEIQISGGQLEVTNGAISTILYTQVPVDEDYDDFSVVVDGSTSSTGNFSFDIVFHADEALENGYVFSIAPSTRTYRFDIIEDNEWRSLLRPRVLPGIHVSTPNTVAIAVDGDNFSFTVNDAVIATYSDDTFTSGKIFLAGSTFSDTDVPISVSFDNLEIQRGAVPRSSSSGGSDGDDSEADSGEDGGDGGGLAAAPENLVECVLIVSGGVEVFPAPDRSSGRVFAAAGQSLFAPHVAGISPSGDWVYIYYFDEGTATDGWVRLASLTLTPAETASLVEIDPDDIPPLPRVPYDSCAERPYGGATNAPVVGQSPVITSVTYSGRCDDLRFAITWADPDGNPSHIDVDGQRQEGIGGTGGTHISNRWECPFDSCRARFTVIDLDGHRSNTVIVDIPC